MAKQAQSQEPSEIAESAGLTYTHLDRPGITCKKHGKSFEFFEPKGKRIRDPETIDRINKLVIPPAYRDVWINPSPRGHIQATGIDARGRLQYRYHPKWREARDENKYDRLIAFGRALPKLRARIRRDLRKDDLPREKVLATVAGLYRQGFSHLGRYGAGGHGAAGI
jgi:DNA topoisomerase-1